MAANIFIGKVDRSGRGRESCHSIFRLIGKNEDALTYALGYLLAHDKRLCLDILKCKNIFEKKRGKNWDKLLKDYSIHLQEVTEPKGGRRDIVIHAPNLRVVIEAKIGGTIPSIEQIRKYTEEFRDHKEDRKAIVALTRDTRPAEIEHQISRECATEGINFYTLRWHEVYEIVRKRSHSGMDSTELSYLYNEFIRFFKEDYDMKYYEHEVRVQDVDEENAKIYREGRMYIGSYSEALYFAPYFTGGLGITHVSRVIEVKKAKVDESVFEIFARDFDKDNPDYKDNWGKWREGLKLILERAKLPGKGSGKGGGFYGKEGTFWFLGEPIKIREEPLRKSKTFFMIPRNFSLRFDELLTLPELGKSISDSES
ncbi:MAG: hypothetical protein FJ008_06815 [Chloroflexi bacterium]|nr:hypothetical protein [Chloroflexota bacterium]MBM3155033.1 hypothetical protein [Chloroflexota bacterium]MBM3175660.1 hypothetical protein [Chloroflexota bacterium]